MRLRRRLWTRKLRSMWKAIRRRKCEVCLANAILLLIFLWIVWSSSGSRNSTFPHCTPIDVVYTWVNGSDPAFIRAAHRYNPSFDPARFDDKNELLYSLRSLERYAPWVRHVYIVTNGQIPHWLDLSYDRVTVVPHHLLAPLPAETLPTFSSATIETFLHRIPKLSKLFLYLNDDIFLGSPLQPEDLYSESEGVRVYQAAWLVPDCAEDCPWTYIGDGACDRHCNIPECQYDGGDCSSLNTAASSKSNELAFKDYMVEPLDLITSENETKSEVKTVRTEIRKFPLRKPKQRNIRGASNASQDSFREYMRQSRNLSTLSELRHIVDGYNEHFKHKNLAEALVAFASLKTTPYPKTFDAYTDSVIQAEEGYKSTKDIYSQSLIRTNMLLNRHYGFKARNVMAHVGFMLDRDIIDTMQEKFSKEVRLTASHRFRADDDVQFSFAYYYFLMSEIRVASLEELFDEFDTDHSQTWSDREVRTFLARMYPLPLDWSALRFFEEVVNNCSKSLSLAAQTAAPFSYSTLVYERYEDSNLPTITRELVVQCPLLVEALKENFAVRPKYKFNINPKRNVQNNFMMLTSNVSEVVDSLDRLRKSPRKFNCINDNLEPKFIEENELVRHLLEDFYLSFFPQRSKFELSPQYRNRFANWHEYQRWRRRKRAALMLGYSASVILILFLLRFICAHKAKFVRRYVQKL